MKITIEVYQSIEQVKEAYKKHYSLDTTPTREDLKNFLSALVEGDLENIMHATSR